MCLNGQAADDDFFWLERPAGGGKVTVSPDGYRDGNLHIKKAGLLKNWSCFFYMCLNGQAAGDDFFWLGRPALGGKVTVSPAGYREGNLHIKKAGLLKNDLAFLYMCLNG